MRRHVLFLLVALLAATPFAGLPASAQEGGSDYQIGLEYDSWAGVGRPEPLPGALPTNGEILQPYEVYFSEDYAAVPEIPDSEFMIVKIMEGSFALAPGDEGTFIVDPADGQPIRYLEEIPDEPYFLPTDRYVRDTADQPCASVCAIPLRTAVQVTTGSTITVREGSLCLWCLLNTNADRQDKGLLIVSVLLPQDFTPAEFSWTQSWMEAQGNGSQASAAPNSAPVTLGWALFNPQARCRGGGP